MVGMAEPRSDSDVERARRAIGLIDLTDLSDDHSVDGIDELCRRAVEHRTAAVCVWPEHVARCRAVIDGATDGGPDAWRPGLATVVNFPAGNQQVGVVLDETLTALSDGATEIDVVLPYTMFRNGDVKPTAAMIESVGDLVAPPGVVKVIVESGELGDLDTIRSAAELAIGLGADFVKTSTGKTAVGATPEAVRTILEAIAASGRPVGVKPSGGIRTVGDAFTYLDIADEVMGADWASPSTFRFGASGLLDALLDVVAS